MILSVAVAAMILFRYGFPTAGNLRQAGRFAFLYLAGAAVKVLGAGIATGGIALISQSPAETAGFIVPDDYDFNGEPHRKRFTQLYLEQIKSMEKARLAVDTVFIGESKEDVAAAEPLKILIDNAMQSGPENLSEELVGAIMEQLQKISKGSEGEGVAERLQKLRLKLKGRRGDRIVVVSAHRLPPATDLLRSSWPPSGSVSAEWVCANPTAGSQGPGVKEPRVLSIWVSDDPLIQPIVRVTAENPEDTPSCTLTWKLLPTSNLKAAPIVSGTFGPPLGPGTAYQPGVSQQTSGVRFAWQFEIPRFHLPRWLTIDIQADTGSPTMTHPWRTPVKLAPNQIRVRPLSADAATLFKRLYDLSGNASPLVLDPNTPLATEGCIVLAAAPLAKAADRETPTLELVEDKTEAPDTGRIELLAPYHASDLGLVTLPPAMTEKWPVLHPPSNPPGEVFAQVVAAGSSERGTAILYRKQPAEYPAWFTLVVPTGKMDKNAAAGHRQLAIYAASMAERNAMAERTDNSRRPAFRQPYLLPVESGVLPLSSGPPPNQTGLLGQLATALGKGGMKTDIRETPGNSVAYVAAPSVPGGLALIVLLTAPLTVAVVILAHRRRADQQ
jgi:hypothetical protein